MDKILSCPAFPFDDPDASHLMRDEITGDYVIIAPGRRYRPDGLMSGVVHKRRHMDPFSPRALEYHERVLATYGKGDLRMTAIENKFPIFHPNAGVGGRQEVLVEGIHNELFVGFSVKKIRAVMNAYVERIRILHQDQSLKYLVMFKNEGKTSGASQPHPHSQIFCLSFVPDRIRDIVRRNNARIAKSGRSLHALTLREATPARTIYRDQYVVAFANPAARFSYEVRILPLRHIDNLTQSTPVERLSLAKALHRLLPLVEQHEAGFNYFFHDVIADTHEPFEIRFAPRTNTWGGFELDAGIVVNAVPAECAAAEYREAYRSR